MKTFLKLIIVSTLLFVACNNNVNDMGIKIQPEGDKISVDTATINLVTSNYSIEYICSRPDSFLLGTFFDTIYGTLHADILTQFQPPIDFKFPVGSIADSAKLQLYFVDSWVGSKHDPMQIAVYEMNKETFQYNEVYRSDIDVSKYCDKTKEIGEHVFSLYDDVTKSYQTFIEIPLSEDIVKRLSPVFQTIYTLDPTAYKNESSYTVKHESEFHKLFKGLYITTNFGSASMLYIKNMRILYWFNYPEKTKTINGTDTTILIKSSFDFPYNDEVRLVNRFERLDRKKIESELNADKTVNHIVSPAGICTDIKIPLNDLRAKLNNTDDKRLLINRAMLYVYVNEFNAEDLGLPFASNLLLLKTSAYERFFQRRELPSDTCAILYQLTSESYKTINDTTRFCYKYDLSKLITKELNKADGIEDTISFRLVPVTINTSSSGNIIEIKEQNRMTATKINSGSHPERPMKIELVYSKF